MYIVKISNKNTHYAPLMLENCEPVRLSIDVFTVRINFNMNMSHTKEIPTRPIYDVLSNKCEIYKRALEQREKKLLWTWIYANLHTPANPTFLRKYSRYNVVEKKMNSHSHSFTHRFPICPKIRKPYIWGIWDNHTHMLCAGRTQQKNEVHSAHHYAFRARIKRYTYGEQQHVT